LGDIFLYHNVGDDILEFSLPDLAYRNLALLVGDYSHIFDPSKHRDWKIVSFEQSWQEPFFND